MMFHLDGHEKAGGWLPLWPEGTSIDPVLGGGWIVMDEANDVIGIVGDRAYFDDGFRHYPIDAPPESAVIPPACQSATRFVRVWRGCSICLGPISTLKRYEAAVRGDNCEKILRFVAPDVRQSFTGSSAAFCIEVQAYERDKPFSYAFESIRYADGGASADVTWLPTKEEPDGQSQTWHLVRVGDDWYVVPNLTVQ